MTFQIYFFIFLAATLILFYFSAPKYRIGILALAGIVFCCMEKPIYLAALVTETVITYAVGLLLDHIAAERKALRRSLLLTVILIYIAFFVLWKRFTDYGVYYTGMIMPLGYSFYTFQAISYLADIYNNKYKPEKNPLNFFLYMSYFPKLSSGPIERADVFLPQIANIRDVKFFDGQRIIKSLSYVLWGLFMKIMVADRVSEAVTNLFEDPGNYGSVILLLGSLAFTIQIYCDFAGYSNMAIGISYLFGLDLTQNFRTPYFADNISGFWRSWHITLSGFFRDYIYIPLGGNRKGRIRKYLNTMTVFLVCGLWHGIETGFVIWGVLHGLYSVLWDMAGHIKTKVKIGRLPGRILTFCCVSFAWIFFKAETATASFNYIRGMFSDPFFINTFQEDIERAGISGLELSIFLAAVTVVFLSDYLARRKDTVVPEMLISAGEIKRDTAFLILAVITLIFGTYGNAHVKDFIYMDF